MCPTATATTSGQRKIVGINTRKQAGNQPIGASSLKPSLRPEMSLSLYSIQAFLILDSEGSRVLAKYYNPKANPQGETKEFQSLKDQKAFEKGLWQKTKKQGGAPMASP